MFLFIIIIIIIIIITYFISRLDPQEWNRFEAAERVFRQTISSVNIYEDKFICKGDFGKWRRIIKIVSGIFVKGGEFQKTKSNGQPWDINFSKFCLRVLKCLPIDPSLRELDNDSTIIQVGKRLSYVINEQPFFTIKSWKPTEEPVSGNKLTELWLKKRKKAIQIIKNGCKWPDKSKVAICQKKTEAFYRDEKLFVLDEDHDPSVAPAHRQEEDDNETVHLFSDQENEAVVKSLPNGKSTGLDGIRYEDVKRELDRIKGDLISIFNTSLVNRRVLTDWKHDIVQWIPKKNYQKEDPTKLRDISLSSVIYKIFSRCLMQRILPFVEIQFDFWQRAFLKGRNRQELKFTLKTALDDFRHVSSKLHILFIDFADAYGSIKNENMFATLREYNIPLAYCKLIENIYTNACFQVLAGNSLTQKIYITRGTKTGDPLSVLLFLLVVNLVLRPAFDQALAMLNIKDEKRIRPLPIQAYTDDFAMITTNYEILLEMIRSSQPLFNGAGLKVKSSKCVLSYDRRSRNNWYKGKNDQRPSIKVQGETIETLKRDEPYKYLGKSLNIAGEDVKQIENFIADYKELVGKIAECTLPLSLKLSALNNMALTKISHHFDNTRLNEKQLDELDDKIISTVKRLFQLYPKSSDEAFFVDRLNGA